MLVDTGLTSKTLRGKVCVSVPHDALVDLKVGNGSTPTYLERQHFSDQVALADLGELVY